MNDPGWIKKSGQATHQSNNAVLALGIDGRTIGIAVALRDPARICALRWRRLANDDMPGLRVCFQRPLKVTATELLSTELLAMNGGFGSLAAF
ncbi:MAG: hypothetical protein ABIY40_07880 [Rhodanobacteraceae bacterium]